MKRAFVNSSPEDLIRAIGTDLMPVLQQQGTAAVREIVVEANRLGLEADELPYVLWALAYQKGLPNLGSRQRAFTVMTDILVRTNTLPAYQRAFQVPDDPEVDRAVDRLADHMATWAVRSMLPALMTGYVKVLTKYASKVPQVTGGAVPASAGAAYLNETFREILSLRSSWFADGDLLRRVVRLIPEW